MNNRKPIKVKLERTIESELVHKGVGRLPETVDTGEHYTIKSITNRLEIESTSGVMHKVGDTLTTKQAKWICDCSAYDVTVTD